MKDVEKSRTSFIRVNLRVLREKHLFQCPRIALLSFFTIRSPFNIRIGHGNSLPIRLLQAGRSSLQQRRLESDAEGRCRYGFCRQNYSSLPLRKLESDANHLSRNDRCRRAIPHCCDDGAAVIRKSEPEIKNRCSNEAVSGQSMQRFPN